EARFDAAWTQHTLMNIADKDALFERLHFVIRPKGRLAVHEVVAAEGQVTYPTPWASDSSQSWLATAADLRQSVTRHGFKELAWEDVTAASTDALRSSLPILSMSGLQALSLRLLAPEEAFRNLLANLEQGRVKVVRGAFER